MLKKNGIATAMCPHTTLRRLLEHPKDITVVSSIFKTETAKHMTGRIQQEQYKIHRERGEILSKVKKFALSDQSTTKNHIIDWKG